MKLRAISLVLTVLTGFTGLVYEVTWQRYLATLLGSHSEATAAVLGLFLGGLAVGYSLFGAVTRRLETARPSNPKVLPLLALYGALELSIGVYAALFPLLFRGAQALSLMIPVAGGGFAFGVDIVLSALLIGPPAILMGGTIPILTQALSRDLSDATRFHALVYGLNTIGAFAGALAAGYWLIPSLGLVDILFVMAAINVFAGSIFLVLSRGHIRSASKPPSPAKAAKAAKTEEARVEGYAIYIAVALLSGFAMMVVQTVLIRIGGLSFGSSQFTFSLVVAVFVLCIAIGSLVVSLAPRIPRVVIVLNQWALFLFLALLYFELQNGPYWAHALRMFFRNNSASFYPYHLSAFVGVLALIGLPVALSGATLPLIFDRLRRRVENLGGAAGSLYSWNTFGSLLGALLGGYVLFFWLDLHQVYRVGLAALALGAVTTTWAVYQGTMRGLAIGLLVIALAAVFAMPAWDPERLSIGLFRVRYVMPDSFNGPEALFGQRDQAAEAERMKIIFYRDGPTASIAVKNMNAPDGVWQRHIVNNGKSDGAIPEDYMTTALIALVPALLANNAERAFMIGYGTGVSVGEFAALDSAKEVIVAEISSAVIEAAPLFDEFNLSASVNPKVKFVRSDAYRALLRSEGLFDVISSEPSNPWVSGVEMLYSVEFLEAARDKLKPGGIYAQWFHSYDTDTETVQLILSTYRKVFEHVSVWALQPDDFLMIGGNDPESMLDVTRLKRRAESAEFAPGLARCGINSFPELIAHELLPLGAVHDARLPSAVHTLLQPRLSYVAARAFFAPLESVNMPVAAGSRAGIQASLVQRYLGRRGRGNWPSEEERFAFVEETCEHRERECLTVIGEWFHDAPDSPLLRRAVAALAASRPDPTLVELIGYLASLYSPKLEANIQGAEALAAAIQATKFYATRFAYSAPFSQQLLVDLWQRCELDPDYVERCRSERAVALSRIGR